MAWYDSLLGEETKQSPTEQSPSDLLDKVLRGATDVGQATQRGIIRGGLSIPSIFGEIERAQRKGLRDYGVGEYYGIDISPEPFLYGLREYESLIPSMANKAETPAGRIVESGAEWATAAAVPTSLPATAVKLAPTVVRGGQNLMNLIRQAPVRQAVTQPTVKAPSIVSEALKSAQTFGGIGLLSGAAEEVGGEMAGTVTGLGATGLVILGSLLKKSPYDLARQATSNIPRAEIERAVALQRLAAEKGIPLSAFETLDSQQLRSLADFVAQSPDAGGKGLLDFMTARQSVMKPAIDAQIETIQKTSRTKPEIANAAQKAADDYIDAARGNVTAATTDLYEAAKIQKIEPQLVSDIVKQLRDKKKLVGKDTAKAIDDMIGRLTGKGGRVVTNIGVLHDELKRLDAIIDMPVDATQKSVYGNLKDPIKSLRDALNTNPNQMAANAIFKERLTAFENMLGETGIEALNKANITPKSAYRVITDFEQVDPANIKAIATALNSQDPTILPDLVRMWMENSADKAFKITATGKPSASAGVKFVQSIRGTEKARANLDAILDAVADAQGVNATELKTGFNDLLDVLERTNMLPATGSFTYPRTAIGKELEGTGGILSIPAKPLSPLEGAVEGLKNMRRRAAVSKLSEAFTDEDSISAILQLAQTKDMSRKRAIVGGLFETVRETTQPETGLLADQ